MDALKLKEVLAAHMMWLRGEEGGVRANLSSANLSSANLSSANLSSADLRFANLRFANLRSANLRFANLSSANLSSADLRFADLSFANLSSANLSSADLRSADLRSADLRSADLRSADLSSASGVDASHLKRKQIVPEVGPFTGFKKVAGNLVAQLEITGERVGGVLGRKCRASEAMVVGFFATDETPVLDRLEVPSCYDSNFVYRLGEVAKVESFDPSMMVECGNGIHFFLSFVEAAEFSL
jgi:hypothetical protein